MQHNKVFPFGKDVPYIKFQADEIPNTYSWAKLNWTLPALTSFSICFHIKVLRARPSYDTIISYDTATTSNELYIGYTLPGANYDIWKAYGVPFRSNYSFNIFSWVRTCFVQSDEEKKMRFWINDEYEEKNGGDMIKIKTGGMFFLGQDQDELGGGFSTDQSLHAYIVNFHFFDKAISQKEAKMFVSCETDFLSVPFIDFYDFESDWTLNGSLEVGNIDEKVICAPKESFIMMFPEKRIYPDTVQLCQNAGGELPVPESPEENEKLHPLIEEFKDICADPGGTSGWIGVTINVENKTYHNYYTGKILTYENFNRDLFIEDYECSAVLSVAVFFGEWYSGVCNTYRKCGTCEFEEISIVKMRGLCSQSVFDPMFLIFGYNLRKPRFRGYYYSDLRWNGVTWVIIDLEYQKAFAEMTMKSSVDYPLGLHDWTVHNDVCIQEAEEKMEIVFTTCNDSEFTCDDGTCVDINLRCDLLLNCPDRSDEINCDIIEVPSTYIKILPPPEEDGSSVKVNVDMIVTSMRSFSLSDLIISYDITINFEWRDSRLTYVNLRKNLDQNQVSLSNVEKIWTPQFYLEDESGSKVTITDHGSQTFISRDSQPLPDDTKWLKEDRLYKGKQNTLKQKRILTLNFLCQFDLSNYPFDIQSCKLVLRATQGKNSVQFVAGKAQFLGERRLLEYQVNDIYLEAQVVDSFSEVTFVMNFSNLYKYYIFGTYVPTSLIVFITYMTFYFSLKDFTNRIMVSLTALMVLAALFLQTNQGVARTAYMKLVDIWFLFCMVFNFVIILVLVIVNYILNNYDNSSVTPTFKVLSTNSKLAFEDDNSSFKEQISEKLTPAKLNKLFRIFFPCCFCSMTVIYTSVVLINWYIPHK